MRRRKPKHVLAVLRKIIGYTQGELAKLAECSVKAIQEIEGGRLGLSEKMAARIASKTGVGIYWLLLNDTLTPPTCADRSEFTRQTFHEFRASEGKPTSAIGEFAQFWVAGEFATKQVLALLLGAAEQRQSRLIAYRLQVMVDALADEFGINISKNIARIHSAPAAADEATSKSVAALVKFLSGYWHSGATIAVEQIKSLPPEEQQKAMAQGQRAAEDALLKFSMIGFGEQSQTTPLPAQE